MSYTGDIHPESYKIFAEDNKVKLSFECPRCENESTIEFGEKFPEEPGCSVEYSCEHPACVRKGERPGYMFELSLEFLYALMLGLNDRPLHDV